MSEREVQLDCDRLLAVLHQLASHVIDCRDVVCVNGVP
jgi:hypothetical protein